MLPTHNNCTGCGACCDVCPKGCISMNMAVDTFNYPIINKDNCIDCGLCKRVCPANKQQLNVPQLLMAGVLQDKTEAKKSASGGAFWAIVRILLPLGYICFGAKYDNSFTVVHDYTTNVEGCESFRKSKYIISNLTGIYKKVKELLLDNKKVLFTGTPCQVSALRNYIGDNDNLFLVDLICHGVTSQTIFNAELEYLQKRFHKKINTYQFKTKVKKNGLINTRRAYVEFEGGKSKVLDKYNDPFLRGYYSRLFYRNSCASCPFARTERCGDITIGDAWDVETIYPEFSSVGGTSLLIFNTDKGLDLLPMLQKEMHLKEVDRLWAVKNNEQLRQPTNIHSNHEKFFDLFAKTSFKNVVFELVPISSKEIISYKLKNFVRGIIK